MRVWSHIRDTDRNVLSGHWDHREERTNSQGVLVCALPLLQGGLSCTLQIFLTLSTFSPGTTAETEGRSENTRTKEIGLCTKTLRMLNYSVFRSSSPEFFLWLPQQENQSVKQRMPLMYHAEVSVWKLRYKLGKGIWPETWIRGTHSELV